MPDDDILEPGGGPQRLDTYRAYRERMAGRQLASSNTLQEQILRKLVGFMGGPDNLGLSPVALDFSLQESANSFLAKLMNKIINSRNELYHSTYPSRALSILKSGKINPSAEGAVSLGHEPGVSMSRIPKIPTFRETSVKFVLDPDKLPEVQEVAEPSFAKTVYDAWLDQRKMNPYNEYETRTVKSAVPTTAVKKILTSTSERFPETNADLGNVVKEAAAQGIPVEHFDPQTIDVYRAAKAWMDYYKLKNTPGIVQGRGLRLRPVPPEVPSPPGFDTSPERRFIPGTQPID